MSPSSGCLAAVLLCAPAALAQEGATPAAGADQAASPAQEPAVAEAPPSAAVVSPPSNLPEPTPAPSPAAPAPVPPPAPAPTLEPRATFDSSKTASAQALPRGPRDFNVELGFGVNGRFGEASGYSSDEGLGAAYGAGFWFTLSERIALGLELLHAGLGHANAKNGASFVNAEYSSSAAWLGGRFVAFRTQDVSLFAALRLGLALEHVSATGTRSFANALEPAAAFDCSGTHGPAFGIGAGIGALVHLNPHLDFVSRLDAHAEQLTSDVVGGCVAGVGATTSLAVGVGLAYGFDGPSYSGDPFAARKRVIGSR